jgi:hypothetical protein
MCVWLYIFTIFSWNGQPNHLNHLKPHKLSHMWPLPRSCWHMWRIETDMRSGGYDPLVWSRDPHERWLCSGSAWLTTDTRGRCDPTRSRPNDMGRYYINPPHMMLSSPQRYRYFIRSRRYFVAREFARSFVMRHSWSGSLLIVVWLDGLHLGNYKFLDKWCMILI